MSRRKVIAHLLGDNDGTVAIRCLTDIEPERNFIDRIVSFDDDGTLTSRGGLFFAHGLVDESDLHYQNDYGRCWCETFDDLKVHCPLRIGKGDKPTVSTPELSPALPESSVKIRA